MTATLTRTTLTHDGHSHDDDEKRSSLSRVTTFLWKKHPVTTNRHNNDHTIQNLISKMSCSLHDSPLHDSLLRYSPLHDSLQLDSKEFSTTLRLPMRVYEAEEPPDNPKAIIHHSRIDYVDTLKLDLCLLSLKEISSKLTIRGRYEEEAIGRCTSSTVDRYRREASTIEDYDRSMYILYHRSMLRREMRDLVPADFKPKASPNYKITPDETAREMLTADLGDWCMPGSTRSNKDKHLLFSEDPAHLERTIRKDQRSTSIDSVAFTSTDSLTQPSTDTRPSSSTDTRPSSSTDLHRSTSIDTTPRTSIDHQSRNMVAIVILRQDENGNLYDQDGHLRNATGACPAIPEATRTNICYSQKILLTWNALSAKTNIPHRSTHQLLRRLILAPNHRPTPTYNIDRPTSFDIDRYYTAYIDRSSVAKHGCDCYSQTG
ncbi:hypothetical protein DY000_02053060 [Brassica cretica]|uniref:Uncharacterized protein n=1 Tax=Brassica cretica TaxID=69181 RepID=A0ABQ7A866_BRACR|nr:hypothetical protein DY000_02053060 [Brassica cretica]